MNDADDFDGMLDSVLRDAANPEPDMGFTVKMRLASMNPERGTHKEKEMAVSAIVPGNGLRQAGALDSVWERLRRRVALPALNPLSLGSVPRSGEPRGFGSLGWALALHGAVLLLLGTWVAVKPHQAATREFAATPLLEAPAVRKTLPKALTAGGGGGQRSPAPAAQGRLPKFAETQIVAPKAPPLVPPKIAVEPTVVMQRDLKMAKNELPNLGLPNSPIVGTGSLGGGSGTGIGAGNGAGIGVGLGANTGGGAMRVGGGVSAPVPVFMPDPEFSEEARRAKVSGNVLVYLWVDAEGRPTHMRVLRGIGMGLDERALAAVKQYRFKPARKDGRPVTVEMNVEVNFQIF